MESRHNETRPIDVTGLSEAAIRAVQTLVADLRELAIGRNAQQSADEWIRELREWAASHRRLDHAADWSRDAIYAGRGE